jgi:hypothetical protein
MSASGIEPSQLQALIGDGKVLAFSYLGDQWHASKSETR